LTPIAAAYGLKSLQIPAGVQVSMLETADLVERVLSSWLAPLDVDEAAHLCISLDAEWNMSCREGVSILQLISHTDADHIYIIPVGHFVFPVILSDKRLPIASQIQYSAHVSAPAVGF
jgi:hypothetical protein